MQTVRFPRFFRDSRAILGALYLTIGIVAQFFPLVGDLHYEFASTIALAASLLAGITAIYRPRTDFNGDETSQGKLAAQPPPVPPRRWHTRRELGGAEVREAVSANVLLALLPLLPALAKALFGESCGLLEGLAWYFLLVLPAAAISTVLALLGELLARRRWVGLIFFLLLWSGSLVRGAYEGFTGPHIYLYAWQVGFFPGGSWDAELPITPLLLVYRLSQMLLAAGLAIVTIHLSRREPGLSGRRAWPAMALGTALAGAALALVAARPELGLTRTDSWLRTELGDSLQTRFATIYYHRPSTDSLALWRAANLADFYITELAGSLGMAQQQIEPVTIYLYASAAEEKRLVGTSSAAFTKPWARTLNMSFASVGSTLRHELAHVMIAPYGNRLLGVSISQGLIEGSAMALENDYLWRSLHQYVRIMYSFSLAPPAEQIMSVGGFSSRRSSVSYVLAGSFSRWLIDRYGMPKYLEAFPWADFDGVYGKSLHQLSEEYRAFIGSLPPADSSQLATARHLFGGGSFFFQKCLRRIGTLNAAGYEALAEERYTLALERFRGSMEEGINYGARAGVLRALAGLGSYRELLDSSASYALDTASYPLLPYLIERGDACWALGDTASARKLYDSVLALDVSQALSLRAALRVRFMSGDPGLAGLMRVYFTRPTGRLQRLMLLSDAYDMAPEPATALILALMRSSLTAAELPVTSVEWLASAAGTGRFADTAGSVNGRSPLDRFILGSLAGSIAPAARYASAAGSPAGTSALALLARFPAQGVVPGSEQYLKEREEEERRFERYLGERTLLP